MTLTLYRVMKAKRWNGQLAPGFSRVGRWHSGGRQVMYFAETSAVAVLEWMKSKMVTGLILDEVSHAELLLVSLTLDMDPTTLHTINPGDLPGGWEQVPNIHSEVTQKLGDAWLARRDALALRVPSATLPAGMGWNVLLNPGHGDYPLSFPEDRVMLTGFNLAHYLGLPRR
jgi:RES domain-containing protein